MSNDTNKVRDQAAKMMEYLLLGKNINHRLFSIDVADLHRSNTPCTCKTSIREPHHKLTVNINGKLEEMCPISLVLQWTRIGLRYRHQKNYDFDYIMKLAKGEFE